MNNLQYFYYILINFIYIYIYYLFLNLFSNNYIVIFLLLLLLILILINNSGISLKKIDKKRMLFFKLLFILMELYFININLVLVIIIFLILDFIVKITFNESILEFLYGEKINSKEENEN